VALGAGGESRGEPLFAWTHGMASSGSIAVNSFFFISGFLVTASWAALEIPAGLLCEKGLENLSGVYCCNGVLSRVDLVMLPGIPGRCGAPLELDMGYC